MENEPISCGKASRIPVRKKRKVKVVRICLTKEEKKRVERYLGKNKYNWHGKGRKKVIPIGDDYVY